MGSSQRSPRIMRAKERKNNFINLKEYVGLRVKIAEYNFKTIFKKASMVFSGMSLQAGFSENELWLTFLCLNN